MSKVELRILGPLELEVDGRRVPLRGTKHQIVLGALLTAECRRVSVSRLIDAVWGEAPPSTGGKQIRNAVSDLRNLLGASGATIRAVTDSYQLDVVDADVDADRFHRLLAGARDHQRAGDTARAVEAFRAALALWTGPALSGLDTAVLQAQAAALNEKRLTALEDCAQLELELGRHQSLAGELSAWAAEHPLRERIVAPYVLALYRAGARAQAFAVYERTRRTLAESLGLSPGPELLDAHRQMLREDTDTPPPRPAPAGPPRPVRDTLPPDLPYFVGRTRELAELLDAAAGGQETGTTTAGTAGRRVIAIDGMGGVGKSVLAVRAAHRLAPHYPDGRYFLDLRGHAADHDPLTAVEGLGRLLRADGVPEAEIPPSAEDRTVLWRQRLAGRRVLLVLDNAAFPEHISPLLADGPDCLTLVTSRRRLPLTVLCPARIISLDMLAPDEARRLFRALVGDRHPAPEPHLLDAVLRHCGHLPLAVSAAAARLRHRPSWPLAHLAARLADPERRLAELQTEHGGLAGCFEASYRHLCVEQQRLLRLLGTSPDRWTDAESAAALLGRTMAVAERLLETLVDEHLLELHGPGRYRMHELVKVYCAGMPELLGPPGRREGAHRRARDRAPRTLTAARLATVPVQPPPYSPHPPHPSAA
ncbi:AfsR/SARP family transcriptional regulator [Streptomyces sp. TRM 70351]|uniref:AfsR/SARP family transcriptional regulator n=1 Tax=Streptomyces sp. TRM 70351 TaxID=3116552 RepID=UPI002E7AE6ED|nr:AfsR/SARP family transcriptional regulator [Streptomyces sp. TRM 70351]MEE1927335.1 AfsR/SARP family transcriptional regulator [Streptomyces sp. TRM 70351]